MGVTRDDALKALDESASRATSIRVELDSEYLRHIAIVEAMPSNQPGNDKSSVWRAAEAFRAHYRHARRA